MNPLNPLKIVGIVDGLLTPIQKCISLVIPGFIEENLRSPAVRKRIVLAVDKLLIKQHPEARLVPKATRQRIISKLLEIMLDDILLPEEAPS